MSLREAGLQKQIVLPDADNESINIRTAAAEKLRSGCFHFAGIDALYFKGFAGQRIKARILLKKKQPALMGRLSLF